MSTDARPDVGADKVGVEGDKVFDYLDTIDESNTAAAKALKKENMAARKRVVKPVKNWLVTGTIGAILGGAFAVTSYVGLAMLLDVLTAPGAIDQNRLLIVVIVLLVALGGRGLFFTGSLMITHVADLRLGDYLRRKIAQVYGRAPLKTFTESSSGKIRKVLEEDVANLHYAVAHMDVEQTFGKSILVFAIGYGFYTNWLLMLIPTVLFLMYFGVYAIMMRGAGVMMARMDYHLGAISERIVEFVAGIAVVKTFGQTGKAHSRFVESVKEYVRFFKSWEAGMLKPSALSYSLLSPVLFMISTLGVGAWLMNIEWATLSEIFTIMLLGILIPQQFMALFNAYYALDAALRSAGNIDRALNVAPISEALNPRNPADATVEVDKVTFAYGENVALRDVTLTIKPGTLTALVGASGSGKTTLATLVARFGDPDQGEIRIGGVPLTEISSETLYQTVSFVLQDVAIFAESVHDNIAMGSPSATREEVIQAAKAAYIYDEIMALPAGFDTILNEDTALSGGQAQRISIARVLLMDTPIVILDEATAFADPESEAQIQLALGNLLEHKTVLVIAHRLGTIVDADQIVVLDNSQVVARGTHTELLEAPIYKQMWDNYTEADK